MQKILKHKCNIGFFSLFLLMFPLMGTAAEAATSLLDGMFEKASCHMESNSLDSKSTEIKVKSGSQCCEVFCGCSMGHCNTSIVGIDELALVNESRSAKPIISVSNYLNPSVSQLTPPPIA